MLESAVEEKLNREIAKLGGMSVKLAPVEPGLPDRLILLPGGRIYLVELKTDVGRLHRAQEVWHDRAERIGTEVIVLHGSGEVQEWIQQLKEEVS